MKTHFKQHFKWLHAKIMHVSKSLSTSASGGVFMRVGNVRCSVSVAFVTLPAPLRIWLSPITLAISRHTILSKNVKGRDD